MIYDKPSDEVTEVWDSFGTKWTNLPTGSWGSGEETLSWGDLIDFYGPITDEKPFEVGDIVGSDALEVLPDGSIVRNWLGTILRKEGDDYVSGEIDSDIDPECFRVLHLGGKKN